MIAPRAAPLLALLALLSAPPAFASASDTIEIRLDGVSHGGFFGHVEVTASLQWDVVQQAYVGRLVVVEDGGTSFAFFHYDVELRVVTGVGVTLYDIHADDVSFQMSLLAPTGTPAVVGMGSARGVGDITATGTLT